MKYKEHNTFYDSRAWRRVRKEVLAMVNNECQVCKGHKRHTRALIIHHVYHLDKYPEYGLSIFVTEHGVERRNLISVCAKCHETVCHPERGKMAWSKSEKRKPLTEEKW